MHREALNKGNTCHAGAAMNDRLGWQPEQEQEGDDGGLPEEYRDWLGDLGLPQGAT